MHPITGEKEMDRPTVQDNPGVFYPPNDLTMQTELPESTGVRGTDVYCPHCLQLKMGHGTQPWTLEFCKEACGTCGRRDHANGVGLEVGVLRLN